MQVSDIEKKPELARSVASASSSQPSGMLSVTAASGALEDQLEHHLAAHVGEQQRGEARERPVHGLASAPAAQVVSREQATEDEPRDEGEHHLVRRGLEGPAEELLREEHAAHEREGEQHEGGQQDAKEQ